MDNLSRTAPSSSFDAFKSKKILRSGPTKPSPSDPPLDPTAHNPWSSKTPEKPINPPRRLRNRGAAISIKDIRECAKKLQIQNPTARSDPVTSPKQPPFTKSHRSLGYNKLPEKYKILDKFFSSLDSSIRLLHIKGTMSTFTNISPKMECLTDRRFTYGHLAQLKYILPEAIEVGKILVRDERTSCMKPDLHVTLNVNAIGDDVEVKENSGNLVLRKVFHARLVEFSKAHPEGDEVPKETLPEPFNQSKHELLDTNLTSTSEVSLINAESVRSQQQPAAASHLSQSFMRKFSKKVSLPSAVPFQTPNLQVAETCFKQRLSGEEVSISLCSMPATKQKGLAPEEFPSRPPTSCLPATPVKIFGLAKNKSSSVVSSGVQGTPSKSTSTPAKSTSTPAKSTSTPAKSISTPKTATPALRTPKRCFMSPDDDLYESPSKLVRRPQRSRSLKFDTPVKNKQVQEINESGNLLMDSDIFDLLPESLLLSIREKEKKTLEDQDPAISQARRRQQIIAGLPKLFDTLHFFFQSIRRSTITKDELMHKIIASQLDIVDRRELEEQLRLLLELVPEWIYEKSACTGDRLLCINKISSPESLRTRLAEAK